MAISETDLLHINRWCREQVPEHLRDQVRVEAELADRHVTIIETRPPWDGQSDWTRFRTAEGLVDTLGVVVQAAFVGQ